MNILIKKLLIIVWVLLLVLFRPSILGERFNALVFFVFIIATGTLILLEGRKNKFIHKDVLYTFCFISILVSYLLVQGLVLGNARVTVVNSVVIILGVSICIVNVSKKENIHFILRSFINIFFFLSASAIVTYAILIFYGFNIFRIPVVANLNFLTPTYIHDGGDFWGSHRLLFPITGTWSSLHIFGVSLPRIVGIFREPGMAQIFFLTAFFLTYFVDIRRARLKRNVILVASFLTFSTSGLLSFVAGYLALRLFGAGRMPSGVKIITTVSSFILLVVLFFSIPEIGFQSKISSESGRQRSESFENSFTLLVKSPIFGDGYYNDFKKDKNELVVSKQFLGVLGVVHQIGIFGLLLYGIVWYWGLFKLGSLQTLCIYVPCLLTLLLSQPSYNDVLVFFLVLTDTHGLTLIAAK